MTEVKEPIKITLTLDKLDVEVLEQMIEVFVDYLENDYEHLTGEYPYYEKEFTNKLKKIIKNI